VKKVWLIKAGEPLPIEGKEVRLYRTGILAETLAARSHEVVWWTSTFNHVTKTHRFHETRSVRIDRNYKLRLLHSVAYKRNVSVLRVVNHYLESRKFASEAEKEDRPDVIVCSLPTIEFCVEAVRYGRSKNVPVILDVRDLWPDLFLEMGTIWLKPFLKLATRPWFRMVRKACKDATAIVGITPGFVEWGCRCAGRKRTDRDRCFPHAYSKSDASEDAIKEARERWKNLGVGVDKDEFIACFFGNFGRQFELETVIEGCRRLMKENRKIRFVLCGSGDSLPYYRILAKGCHNLLLPGRVNKVDIYALMSMSSIGLAPYRSNIGFKDNLPNKPVEYWSFGLPVLSSLDGLLSEVLSENQCGVTYRNGDVEGFVRSFLEFYENRQRLADISMNAIKFYEANHNAEKVYARMADYLEEISQKEV
jgi:glycosyltransferase involved in cell wall biosynthesis